MDTPVNRPRWRPFPNAKLGDRAVFAALLALGGLGLTSFLWEGFREHPIHPTSVFDDAWALFVWFIVLMLAAERIAAGGATVEGFRLGPVARRSLYAVTLAAALGTGIVRLAHLSQHLPGILNQVLQAITTALSDISTNRQASLNALNFSLLVLLVVILVGARFFPDIVGWTDDPEPILGERTAADFLTLAIFSLFLSVLVLPPVMTLMTARLQTPIGGPHHACDLALFLATCDPNVGPQPIATIFAADFFFVPATCIVIAAFVVAMAAVGEALKLRQPEEFVSAFVSAFAAVLKRRVNLANILVTLRPLWPLPVIMAVAVGTQLAYIIQIYLIDIVGDDGSASLIFVDPHPRVYFAQLAAIGLAAVMIMMTHGAVSLLLLPRHMQSITHLRVSARRVILLWWNGVWQTGLLLVLVYVVFSFILWVLNALVVGIGRITAPHSTLITPFIQPDLFAVVSAAACIYVSLRLFLRSRHLPPKPDVAPH